MTIKDRFTGKGSRMARYVSRLKEAGECLRCRTRIQKDDVRYSRKEGRWVKRLICMGCVDKEYQRKLGYREASA